MKPLSKTARDTGARIGEVAQKTADNAKATAETARAHLHEGLERARVATSDLATMGREQAEAAREAASEALDKGKAQARRANSRLKQIADEQPLTLVAGAAALGALLGSLIPGRRD